MSHSSWIVEKSLPCPKDGYPIKIPEKSGIIKCEACGHEFHYSPELYYESFLRFKCDNGKEFIYEITSDIIIGKNSKHVLSLFDQVRPYLTQDIPIRIAYISKNHLKINKKMKYEFIKQDDGEWLVNIPVCTIEDNRSSNGTMVNSELLSPGMNEKILRHGDKIILAPNCKKYVEIEYLEKRKH